MIEINKSLHGANGKIKAVYLGTTPVVMYLGNQLLYDVDLDAEYVLMDIEDGDTIDSTIEAPIKSATLKGHALINLINSTQNMAFSYSTAEAKEVYTINDISPRKLNITVNTQPTYWYYITVKINIDLLKPNTKYLIKAKNLNNIVSAQICEGSGNNKLAVQKPFMDNSYAIITTNDLSTLNGKEILYIVITDFKKNTIEYPTTISVEDIMLIEYQEGMENWDIPYFEVEGMQSVKMPVLTTTGKNIIKNSSDVYVYENHDGTNKLSTFTQLSLDANYKQMLRGKEVAISVDAIGENLAPLANVSAAGGNHYGVDINVIFEDGTSQWLSLTKGGGIPVNGSFNGRYYKTFTVQDKPIKQVSTCQLFCRTTMGKLTLTNVQLEIGNANSNYEPYKSNILTVNEPVELRGIGDVQDTLDLITSEMIENFESFTFNGSEDWRLQDDSLENTTRFILLNYAPNKVNNQKIGITNTYEWGIFDEDKPGIIMTKPSGHVYLRTSKMSVDELKTMLSNNPIHGYYNKEKSIKTVDLTITDQDNKTISTINTFNDTTHFTVEGEEGKLQPTVSMEIACNPSQSVMALADQTEQLQQEQQELTEQIEQQEQDTNILQTATTDLEEV